MSGNSPSFVVLSFAAKSYPSHQPFLEEVIAKGLPSLGHKVIWLLQSGSPRLSPGKSRWHGSEVFVCPALPKWFGVGKFLNHIIRLTTIWNYLKRMASSETPNLIQIRNDWMVGLLMLNYRKNGSTPIVFQFTFPTFEARLESARSSNFIKAFALRIISKVELWGVLRVLHQVDHILPISGQMKKYLIEKGISAGKMSVFPMGVVSDSLDYGDGKRISFPDIFHEGEPVIIYFGSMDRMRRLEFLLSSFSFMLENFEGVKLLMVGGTEDDIKRLQAYGKGLNIKDRVHFAGHVKRTELFTYIRAAQLSLSPIPPIQTYMVSFPTKVVESLMLACPVVATNIPEQKDLLQASGGGLTTAYSEKEFASAMSRLLKSPEEAKQMGKLGQRYVNENLSYADMTPKLIELYSALVKAKMDSKDS